MLCASSSYLARVRAYEPSSGPSSNLFRLYPMSHCWSYCFSLYTRWLACRCVCASANCYFVYTRNKYTIFFAPLGLWQDCAGRWWCDIRQQQFPDVSTGGTCAVPISHWWGMAGYNDVMLSTAGCALWYELWYTRRSMRLINCVSLFYIILCAMLLLGRFYKLSVRLYIH